jgi:aminopeptidase-like protein
LKGSFERSCDFSAALCPAELLVPLKLSFRMKSMMEILQDLTPLGRAVCSLGYDQAVEYLRDVLPFRVISVPDSHKHNGWVIPPSWDVEEAQIMKDGRTIYDGIAHPLGVIALSRSFSGSLDLEALRGHLHYDHRYDDSIPYHYRQLFRSWDRDWGFCVPKQFFDQLTPGNYEVVIRTREAPGAVKILEYKHQGSLGFTIVFGANLDHAGVANDGLAGCVVGIEVLRRLAGRKTKFTYSLVLSPGIIGSELYLAGLKSAERSQILEGIFLEMLGSATPLAVQDSRRSMVSTLHALKSSLDRLGLHYRTGPFEGIIVNDEYLWENYGIPMLSFSRFPYPEYHSSRDGMEIIKEESLNEAVEALMGVVDRLESSQMIMKKFEGNICLSNPQYDLYVDYGQVALGDSLSEQRRRMRHLMDFVPALDRPVSVKAVADHFGLSESETLEYFERWASKGLIDLL